MSEGCPAEAELRAFAAGTAVDESAVEIGRHIDSCESCQRWLDAFFREADAPLVAAPSALPMPEDLIEVALGALGRNREAGSDTKGPLQVGPFEVRGTLGRGGMGVVYRAHDQQLNREVALKVLSPGLLDHSEATERFLREARAAAALDHPNVLPIHSIGGLDDSDDGGAMPYLTMPYIAGGSLEAKLGAPAAPMDMGEAIRIARGIAAGLAAAHEAGIIHRDIKPANILIDADGRLLIADFGLARIASEAALTREDFRAGTPQFMAPEQIRGEPVDARADLFAFGALLYRMVTGQQPFAGDSVTAVLHRIESGSPPSARAVNGAVPFWLSRLIERLLEKDASDRPPTAAEVLRYLESEAAPGISPRRLRRRRAIGFALAGVAALSFGFCALEWGGATSFVNAALSKAKGAPFSIRGSWGAYESLADCWDNCSAGDTIEIRLTGGHRIERTPSQAGESLTLICLGDGGRLEQDSTGTVFQMSGDCTLRNIRFLRQSDAPRQSPIIAHRDGSLTLQNCEVLSDGSAKRQPAALRNSLIQLQDSDARISDSILSSSVAHAFEMCGRNGSIDLENVAVRGFSFVVMNGTFEKLPIALARSTVFVGSVFTVASPYEMSPVEVSGHRNALSGISFLWRLGGDEGLLDLIELQLADTLVGGFRVLFVGEARDVPRGSAGEGAALAAFRDRWRDAAPTLKFADAIGSANVTDRPAGLRRFELGDEWSRYGFRSE